MQSLSRTELDEDFWEDLLLGIEERRVIPIIGHELLQYEGQDSFDRQVAHALVAKLRLDEVELPLGYSVNDVASAHMRARGRREDLYARLFSVVRQLDLPPPQALLDLAAVDCLDLFVSLTFDTLMVDALDKVRHAGAARTMHLAFAPNRQAHDLPSPRAQMDRPVVYSLLGRLSSMPEYAVSEEDTLEFLTALQTDAQRPSLVFDELRQNHLLLLGCSFPDWLARFFIRIAKSRQLSAQRAEVETIVERRIAADPALTVFLERFSYGTRVRPGDPVAFAAEMARRWRGRNPTAVAQRIALPADAGAVFISYASEDENEAVRLCEALQGFGLDVWLDRQQLQAGDLYDQMIRRRIRSCLLFLPVVSQSTTRRIEGYFRREWRWAMERLQDRAEDLELVVPVSIDGTGPDAPGIPGAFANAHWTRLPHGQPDNAFCAHVVALVRKIRKRQAGVQ